jgi:hypothetical protein
VLKQFERRFYRRIKGTAQKFLCDLNAEIEMGWTGFGQTNYILGKIAARERVFFHALHGGEPLSIGLLAERIVEVAEFLPGDDEWCQVVST